MLFGSVARGEATNWSDIDLVAIYDDLDYGKRGEIAEPLRAAAAEAAGFPVDVLVTDRPEWKMRTSQVRTSLEARAARGGMVLIDRLPGYVNWGKEMVMPDSDYQEGLYRLGHVATALIRLSGHLKPGVLEGIHTDLGNTEDLLLAEIGRMLALGGAAHSVTEHSVKALIHVTAGREAEMKGHRIERLYTQLAHPNRTVVERLLRPLSLKSITPWHWYERYHRIGTDPDPTPKVVAPLIRAACRLATYTADYFGTDGRAPDVRLVLDHIEGYLDTYDLGTGKRLTPLQDEAPV